MDTIEILGRHTSYNVQKVLWLADELSLDYRHKQIGGRHGGTDSADFLRLNPLGKVPVLLHNDKVLCESNTIVRYLADVFSGGLWISPRAYQRSLAERWMDWSIEKLEPAFVGVFWGYYRTPPESRNELAIAAQVAECEACLQVLGQQLAGRDYLLGDRPSVADVATAVYLHRLFAIERPIAFPDATLEWYRRLGERPAYARWVKSDFTELRGRAAY